MKSTTYTLLLAVFCTFATLSTNAQVEVTAGPEAGFTASGLYADNDDVSAGINGHFGGTARLQFGNYFAIRPSVLLKFGRMSNTEYDDTKLSLTRIAVPIPIMYSQIFNNGGNLFAGAGPNLMYALSGKVSNDYGSGKIEFGNKAGQMKRLDVGLHAKAGYQFASGLALSTFVNFGFTNLVNESGAKLRSLDAIGFSIGYMFGGSEY